MKRHSNQCYCFLVVATLLLWPACQPRVAVQNEPSTRASDTSLSNSFEFIACSQNLNRFGCYGDRKNQAYEQRLFHIVRRVELARCDILAVQEVCGAADEAHRHLASLAAVLTERLPGEYLSEVGRTNDETIRNGMIYRSDRFVVDERRSFANIALLSLVKEDPVHYYSRGPIMLRLQPRQDNGNALQAFGIDAFSFHFKSQARGYLDLTQTRFEFTRIEMAARLYQTAALRLRARPRTLSLLMGDRNSEAESASAKVLAGEIDYRSFVTEDICSVTMDGAPLGCRRDTASSFVPALVSYGVKRNKVPFSYRYRGQELLLDEIYLGASSDLENVELRCAGTVGTLGKGSDHLLVWAALAVSGIR